MKTFRINTYGCQMNAHESERLVYMLEHNGFTRADKESIPNVMIFNTCCIRNTAEQKIIAHIGNAKKLKKTNPNMIIAVIGCLSANKKLAGVDILLGTNQLDELIKELEKKFPNDPQKLTSGSAQFGIGSSVIIMHGCENFCSYCVVPYVRGKEYSRDIAEIESEFDDILRKRENQGSPCSKSVIYLLGQNVNSYKCPRTGTDFVGLLDKLCARENDFQINFLSSHPKDFSPKLVDCIARNKKIERNIHLPMQSGCNKILNLMNRKYTVEDYMSKIELLRAKVHNVHITTDIICGFPGETEDDFTETISAMKKLQFNAAFIFPYSRRSGTAADTMDNQLDTATKKRRTTELITLQRQISNSITK